MRGSTGINLPRILRCIGVLARVSFRIQESAFQRLANSPKRCFRSHGDIHGTSAIFTVMNSVAYLCIAVNPGTRVLTPRFGVPLPSQNRQPAIMDRLPDFELRQSQIRASLRRLCRRDRAAGRSSTRGFPLMSPPFACALYRRRSEPNNRAGNQRANHPAH